MDLAAHYVRMWVRNLCSVEIVHPLEKTTQVNIRFTSTTDLENNSPQHLKDLGFRVRQDLALGGVVAKNVLRGRGCEGVGVLDLVFAHGSHRVHMRVNNKRMIT